MAISNKGTRIGKKERPKLASPVVMVSSVSSSVVSTFAAMRELNHQATMARGMDISNPIPITVPKCSLRPRLAAPAMLPGCGGSKVCVMYKPLASPHTMAACLCPLFFASGWVSPLKMMYPLSQKMGMPTTTPITVMAATDRPSPAGRWRPLR